jgi:hypothetical protein
VVVVHDHRHTDAVRLRLDDRSLHRVHAADRTDAVVAVEDYTPGGLAQNMAAGIDVQGAASQPLKVRAQPAQAVRSYSAHLLEEKDASTDVCVDIPEASGVEKRDHELVQRAGGDSVGHTRILVDPL